MAQTSYGFFFATGVAEVPVRQCSKGQSRTPIGDCVVNWTPASKKHNIRHIGPLLKLSSYKARGSAPSPPQENI